MTISPAVLATTCAALAAAGTGLAAQRAWFGQRASTVVDRLAPPAAAAGPPPWFQKALTSSGLTIGADGAWKTVVRCGAAALCLAAWRWPQFVVAVITAGVVISHARRRTRARQEHRDYDVALSAVVDVMISRLATGTSLAMALREGAADPSPVGRDLTDVIRRHDHGQALQSAVDLWAVNRATPGVRLLADALALAGRSGGSQRAALVGVQATLRDHEALAREVRALASQARTSGVVLAVTPAAFAGVVALVDTGVAQFFATPAGWACLIGGALLDGAGALWMSKLTEAHS